MSCDCRVEVTDCTLFGYGLTKPTCELPFSQSASIIRCTMGDVCVNLDAVYAKWEARNPHKAGYVRPSPTLHGRSGSRSRSGLVSGPQPQRRDKYRSQNRGLVNGSISLAVGKINCLASFKMAPTVHPYTGVGRPLMGRCCSCLPNSKNQLYEEEDKRAGLNDIFKLDTAGSENGFLTRTFSTVTFVLKRKIPGTFPDVSLEVLTSSRLLDAVHNTSKTQENGPSTSTSPPPQHLQDHLHKRATRLVKRMRARISKHLIRFTGWFLHKFLGSLLTSILINRGQVNMLKKATKRDIPIIYLPTHRSHLDYILITFILFNLDIKAPHVAAGDNLLIPLFGALMRGLGGYFIRRRLDRKAGQKDLIYRAVLHTYMEELLKRGEYFEFFIEGGRTRSGKALYPKGGLLSVVVDSMNEGLLSDVQIVPVSISYDKLLDGNFCREQMGSPKKLESFWRAWAGIFRVLTSDYGNVRVDFGQPFSLKEYMSTCQRYIQPSPRLSLDHSGSFSSAGSDSPPCDRLDRSLGSDQSIYGCAPVVGEDMRQTVQCLAEHVVFSQVHMQAVMSTQLLAFIFLTQYRQGANLRNTAIMFDWLKQEIMGRGRDLGFSGHTTEVIAHAQELLGQGVICKTVQAKKPISSRTEENNNMSGLWDVFYTPNTSLPHVFELSYYSNVVTSVFAVESVMAHAIMSQVGDEEWSQNEVITVSQEAILETTTCLCDLLKYEFIFTPPCTTLSSTLFEAFNSFTASDILVQQEDQSCYENTQQKEWASRLASSLACNEDSDEEDWHAPPSQNYYQMSHELENLEKFHFFRSVLAPVLETYYITICNLTRLLDADMTEDEFTLSVHVVLKDRVYKGVAAYAESAALDTLKNAIKGLLHTRVLTTYTTANVAMLSLADKHRDETHIQTFLRTVGLHSGVPLIPL